MKAKVYIRLLNEGTDVYRPVPALRIRGDIYKLEGYEIYDPKDENWEFPPGSRVIVKEKILHGGPALVAIKKDD